MSEIKWWKPSWEWRKEVEALTQQLAEMTQAWRDGQAEISRLSVFHEDDEPSWRHRAEALTQQLATMTQERDQWKQGHNDAVRVGLEYQRQLTALKETK